MSQAPDTTSESAACRREEPSSTRLVATLSIAGLLSGLIIVSVYEATLPTIKAYQARMLREAVFKVLPGADHSQRLVYTQGGFEPKETEAPGEAAIFGGYDAQGALVGYAIPSQGPGFQDTISLLYGYMPETRQVTGMEILESRETPGLGDKIYKDASFVAEFSQLAIDPEIRAVKKGSSSAPNTVDAITGATISSKAVVRIINEGNARWLSKLPDTSHQPPPPSHQPSAERQRPTESALGAKAARNMEPADAFPSLEHPPRAGSWPLATGG